MTKRLPIAMFLAGALVVLTNGPEGRSEPPGGSPADPVGVLTAEQATELGVDIRFPYVGDFDGDGINDLLVGKYGGQLRVYRNTGTNAKPVLAKPVWFDDANPTGRIPSG